jgi:hypothetical protein
MRASSRQVFLTALQIYDMGVLCVALMLATILDLDRAGVSVGEVLSIRIKLVNFVLVAVFLLGCHRLFVRQGLYQSRRTSRRLEEIPDIIIAVSLATVALGLGGGIFRVELVTPYFLATFWVSSSATLVGSRLLLRTVLARLRRQGRNLRHMLIVGTNDRAVRFARTLEAKPDLGYSLLGFADEPWAGLGRAQRAGFAIVSDSRYLEDFLRNSVVDEVLIALPLKSKYAGDPGAAPLGSVRSQDGADESRAIRGRNGPVGLHRWYGRLANRLQASSRHRACGCTHLRFVARTRLGSYGHQADVSGSRTLRSGAGREGEATISALQVPHDGRRCGSAHRRP